MNKMEKIILQPLEFIDSVIKDAIKFNATDIHWEPYLEQNEIILVVRLRIDGVLRDIARIEKNRISVDTVINALKVMAGMDTTKKRREQDGRAKFSIDGVELDLRFSSMPVLSGEKIVVRVINREKYLMKLEDLGITPENIKLISPLISKKEGFILIVGPTGSGKTTTLYSMLNLLSSRQRNICTIEDPVECRVSGFNQIQIEHTYGMTFVTGLRSIMRQDPDIIAVGEMRDAETARIAFQAALAGSLVFSTIHARDCVNAIVRLLEMGVEPYFIAASLTGVISIRLVRLLCKLCKGAGCAHCNNLGFKNRIGLFEIMKITDKLKNLILEKASQEQLKKAAVEAGMQTFQDSAAKLVALGFTSQQEVNKVFTLDEL